MNNIIQKVIDLSVEMPRRHLCDPAYVSNKRMDDFVPICTI